MSKRLEILKALTDHLKGITPANGYTHNLSNSVFRGRERFGDNHKQYLPMISILEPKAPEFGMPANEEQTVRKDDWILLIQGWAKDDPLNPTDPAYLLVAEVEKRLSDIIALNDRGQPIDKQSYRLGNKIATLVLAAPIVRPPEDGLSDAAFFYLPIRIGHKVDIRNP